MTDEKFTEIANLLYQIDIDKWDPKEVLEMVSFNVGFMCGKGFSLAETQEFMKLLINLEENQNETESSNSN